MKRIQSAMLVQTLKFVLSDKLSHEEAVAYSEKEAKEYVEKLSKSGTKYLIVDERKDTDGASIIEVKKQYGTSSVGSYF